MSRYQLDGYAALEGVRNELAAFLESTFRFANPDLDRAVHQVVQTHGILAPRVVEPTFPYEEPAEAPRTMADLAKLGLVHPELVALLEKAEGDARWQQTRPLYSHQVEAIKNYRNGKSLIVASGTGSGKTECFLIPTIDNVLRDHDLSQPGIRVLLVYPLNALVNNQMDRLRAIVGHHPQIRFALYTRRLAQTEKVALRKLRASGRQRYPAEVISREALRAAPPHILITNFSMLEYALVRPADAPLFATGIAPRLYVLDEAHVYAGSLAAELTLLLRRAWLRWGMKTAPQGIVTSATMHQAVDDGAERLHRFAVDLLSKDKGEVVPIDGKRVAPGDCGAERTAEIPSASNLAAVDLDFPTLHDAKDESGTPRVEFDQSERACAGATAVLKALGCVPVADQAPGLALWHALEPLSWVRKLRRDLHSARAERVDVIASSMFPGDAADVREKAVLNLLGILAIARQSPQGLPLMPVRLHGVVRGPHGVFACINAACPKASVSGRLGALFPDPVLKCACGASTIELRVCEGCGQSFLGAEEGEDDEGLPALASVGAREVHLFVPGKTWDDGTPIDGGSDVRVYSSGRIANGAEGTAWTRFDGGRVRGATRQLVDVPCPKCEASIPGGSVLRRVEAGTDASLEIVVDGLYPSLPHHPNPDGLRLPGDGRRALLFADNRQVAAALAAKIEESHDVVMSRVLLVRALEGALKNAVPPQVVRLQNLQLEAIRAGRMDEAQALWVELQAEAKKPSASSVGYNQLCNTLAAEERLAELSTFSPDRRDDVARLVITRELGRRPARRGNLEASGVVIIDYELPLARPTHPDVATTFNAVEWRALVEVVLDLLRTSGLVQPPVLSWHARQHLQLYMMGKTLVKTSSATRDSDDEGDDNDDRKTISFLPASVTRGNRLVDYVTRVLAQRTVPPTVQPRLVLEEVWQSLTDAARADGNSLISTENGLRLPIEKLSFRTALRGDQWRCKTCKTVWARQVAATCPTSGCTGTLEAFERGALDARERLVALTRSDMPLLGLRTEEHTAQIGVERLEESEQNFKAGKVNVLTSSTTMELGIDIGGLSATVLTNVPPGASNYLQRAGRAGRRAEGTSLVLTFARPRPFDQASFVDPLRPFRDRIVPPVVRLDTDRIVRRHVNAFLLAYFFREYEAQGDVSANPMASLRTVTDFFFRLVTEVLAGKPAANEVAALGGGAGATLSDAFEGWLLSPAQENGDVRAAIEILVRGTCLEPHSLVALCAASASQITRIGTNAREQRMFLDGRIGKERERPETSRDVGAIAALELQKGDLENGQLLGYLAEEQYLPRYGFPVQVVSLDHRFERTEKADRPVEEDDAELRLTRDISLAISEYAPGAEIVAGKEVHRSSGLLRHWTGVDIPGVLANRFVAVCQLCGQLQYGRTEGEIRNPCPTCHEGIPRVIRVLEPTQGFAVAWGKAPKRWIRGTGHPLRPVTEAAYAARDGQSVIEVSPGLSLGYDNEGQILVRAEGQLDPAELPGSSAPQAGTPRAGYGYAICYLCGRAEPENAPMGDKVPLPGALKKHQRLRGDTRCEATTQYWRHTSLAGAVRTETLTFQLRGPMQFASDAQGRRWATTWMVALQLSAGELLGIDSRNIGGLLVPRSTPSGVVHDALLYDQQAGGAGHCRALLARWRELVDGAKRRLDCQNGLCTNACHRCLIAFETQRYEETLRRTELAAFLALHWEELIEQPARDGIKVAALVRGRSELLEMLKREPATVVTVFTPSISPDALDDHGWLRALLLHAEGRGRLRLVVETLPDPDADAERFLARRLGVAIEAGRCELLLAKEALVAAFPWRVVLSDSAQVFHLDPTSDAGLGPSWVDGGVFVPTTETDRREIVARAESIVTGAKCASAADFEPGPLPPSVKWRHVPAMEPASRATFAHWLTGPDDESLFARPLKELHLVDPYIASEWQLDLLAELCVLARSSKCKKIRVDTYAPEADRWSSVRPEQQKERIAAATGDAGWKPMGSPLKSIDKVHKRLLRGVREDGTSFEVLFERGLDFIFDRRGHGRTTRETFIIVRDPA